GFSKLLRTDKGVEWLTQGLTIPRRSSRGAFLEKKLKQVLGEDNGQPPQGPPNPNEGGGAPDSSAAGGGQPSGPPGGRISGFLRPGWEDDEGGAKTPLGGE